MEVCNWKKIEGNASRSPADDDDNGDLTVSDIWYWWYLQYMWLVFIYVITYFFLGSPGPAFSGDCEWQADARHSYGWPWSSGLPASHIYTCRGVYRDVLYCPILWFLSPAVSTFQWLSTSQWVLVSEYIMSITFCQAIHAIRNHCKLSNWKYDFTYSTSYTSLPVTHE